MIQFLVKLLAILKQTEYCERCIDLKAKALTEHLHLGCKQHDWWPIKYAEIQNRTGDWGRCVKCSKEKEVYLHEFTHAARRFYWDDKEAFQKAARETKERIEGK